MPEKIALIENDYLAAARTTHYIDETEGKRYSRTEIDMSEAEKMAHQRRQEEGMKGTRFKNPVKSIGILPAGIFNLHPEFLHDDKALIEFLEAHPKLKTTNANLSGLDKINKRK